MNPYAKDPSSFMRLIGCGQESIGFAAAEDLTAFLDLTPYEYVLVVCTCSVIGTSTNLTVKFVSSDASSGTSPVVATDAAGVDLSATIAGAGIADGNTVALQVRTRGLKKWGSPQLQAATAAMGVAYAIWGIGVRDTAELAAGWVDEASATVLEASSGNAFAT